MQGDALTVDLDALLAGADAWKLVANLPYNVATPLVARVLEEAPTVFSVLVMVQREVGERLAAPPGDKDYGAISVKVAYFGRAKVVGSVPRTVFMPEPNVDSALVRIDRHPAPTVDVPSPDALFALVRTGFAQRRKMLRRALQPALGARATEVLEDAGVDPQRPRGVARPRGLGRGRPGRNRSMTTYRAPAKLTLSLRVLGTRPDGFHELTALTVSVDAPQDRIDVTTGPAGVRLTVDGPEAAGVPTDGTNLVVRAAQEVLPDGAGLDVALSKRIPAGAGLGGGSSDAAAVLRACARICATSPRPSSRPRPPRSARTSRSASSARPPGCGGGER